MNTHPGVSRSFFRFAMGEKFRWDELSPSRFFTGREFLAYELLPALNTKPHVYIGKLHIERVSKDNGTDWFTVFLGEKESEEVKIPFDGRLQIDYESSGCWVLKLTSSMWLFDHAPLEKAAPKRRHDANLPETKYVSGQHFDAREIIPAVFGKIPVRLGFGSTLIETFQEDLETCWIQIKTIDQKKHLFPFECPMYMALISGNWSLLVGK